ncbi:proton-conducting transporter transmembrane domain-containing protein [Natronococcus amylolyticus]|nr:proton-conducting transporter membrane subunit [Natronococcus amylolyticus]
MIELQWLVGAVVGVPLGAAVFSVLANGRLDEVGWPIAAASLSVTFVLSVVLAVTLVTGEPIQYRLSSARLGYATELQADGFSGVIVLLDSLVALGALAYTRTAGPRGNIFYGGYLAIVAGVIGVTLTGDLFVLSLFLLLLGLSTVALVDATGTGWDSDVTRRYVVLWSLGVGVYLAGVAVAVVATGTANMALLAERLPAVGYADPLVVASFLLMAVGLGISIGLFPFHTWLVDAHGVAPDALSALISGVIPAAAVYAFSRILFTVYTTDFLAANPILVDGILAVSLGTMLLGNLLAAVHRGIKDVLAYSTISQAGLVVAGFVIANEDAIFGSILQLFGHGIVKGALCLVAGIFALRFEARSLEEYAGLANEAPLLGATFALLGIAMIGLPPTVPSAVVGGLVHLPVHAVGKLTLFFCAGALAVECGTKKVSEMAGIGRRMPLTMVAFAVGAASLASIPLFAGFVSKWHLLLGSAEADNGLVLALFVVSGGLNVAYFWPIVYAAFFEDADPDPKPIVEEPMGGARADGGAESEPTDASTATGRAQGDGGLAVGTEWERRTPTGAETTWLLLGPILAVGGLVVAVGIAADWLFVLEAARMAAESAGVSPP